ncbi:hypothetical protein ACI3ER_11320 [Bacillus sp. Wb]
MDLDSFAKGFDHQMEIERKNIKFKLEQEMWNLRKSFLNNDYSKYQLEMGKVLSLQTADMYIKAFADIEDDDMFELDKEDKEFIDYLREFKVRVVEIYDNELNKIK